MLSRDELERETKNVIEWVREFVKNANAKGIVVGNSGGKDSAAVIAIAVNAVRKRKCTDSCNTNRI